MKPSIIAVMLLASTTLSSLAQELSVELPQVAALNIEGSRAIEGRVLEQPQLQGRRKWNVYRVKVEIDVSVAGQRSTYVFNCIHSGQANSDPTIGYALRANMKSADHVLPSAGIIAHKGSWKRAPAHGLRRCARPL